MCGIAGLVNPSGIDVDKMLLALRHRGPDDQQIYTHENIVLLHTRLSIQDVALGAQPFHAGNYSITFNGEIYNHQSLRRLLGEYNFLTNSDTETLIYLYQKYKTSMFDMIDGMYAFCIYDKTKQQLIFARDRAGKKPLYYYHDSQHFLFSSELNALKTVKKFPISTDAIQCYLRTGFIWRPDTVYQQVKELEPGACLTLDLPSHSIQSYTHFNLLPYYQDKIEINIHDATTQLDNRLRQSVRDRINASDVEVGVFLSGGIDSNLIAAMAAQEKPKIKTFTVKFTDGYDESHLARLTATKYNTHHIELPIVSQLDQDIEKILSAYGEPFMDSSAIPSYYVAREAQKYVKVILSGDGADELFGGYRRYVPIKHQFMQHIKFLTPMLKWLPKPATKKSFYNFAYRLLAMSNKNGLDFYTSSTYDVFDDVLTIGSNAIIDNLQHFITTLFKNPSMTALQKMLYADFNILLFCDLLVKMDIAAMANSLEVRSPFLSKYLLEFVPRLPDSFKINGIRTKYILRKLAEKYLPAPLIKQPKRGFEVPLKKWVAHELKDPIFDVLKPGCFAANFVDDNFIRNILADKLSISAEKRAKIIWSLYCLEVWYRNETKNFSYS